MNIIREAVEHLFNVGWESGAGGPFGGQGVGLFLSWDFTGDQEPEKRFWEWFDTT